MANEDASWIGRRIRNIEIEELLGSGGMGRVYLGFDHALHRRVALKVLRPSVGLSDAGKARFLREARTLSRLEHPGICRIYDLLEHNGVEILVLELVPGVSLAKALREPPTERRRMAMALGLTEALVAAHSAGIVHRDLKPENVMWAADQGPDGQVKVLDFGLARAQAEGPAEAALRPIPRPRFEDVPTERAGSPRHEGLAAGYAAQAPPASAPSDRTPGATLPAAETLTAEDRRDCNDTPGVTRLGTVVGTVAYMSPEQARGEPVNSAGDIFSLGLILHEVFSGRPAIDPKLPTLEKLKAVSQAATRPLSGLDPSLAALIRRMESLNPEDRPRAADVLERLQWIAGRPRRRLRWGVIGLLLLLLLGFGAVSSWESSRRQGDVDRLRAEVEREERVNEAVLYWLGEGGLDSEPAAWESLEELRAVARPEVAARLDAYAAMAAHRQGRDELSEHHLSRLRQAARSGELEPVVRYRIWRALGEAELRLGRTDAALIALNRSLGGLRDVLPATDVEIALGLRLLAEAYWTAGDWAGASRHGREALVVLSRPEHASSSRAGRERQKIQSLLDRQVTDQASDDG